MWVCPNDETANHSNRKTCIVCGLEKPFSNENPNSPSILKSKIQELEEQILILNEEQISLNQSKETLSSELSRVKYALNTSNSEKDNLKKQLEKITSEKTSVENKLKQIEKDKTSLSSSLTTTKAEWEKEVTNLKAEVEKLKQDDNTGCLGIIVVVLIIALVVSVVTCSTKNGETVIDTSKVSELENQVKTLQSKTEQLQNEKQKIENKLQVISSEVPFVVTSIDFENSAERNNYKRNFNYNKVRYISPRLKIIPISNSWSGKISVKYFEPSGTLNRNSTVSPLGFTFADETNIYSTQEYIYLSGWGSDSGSTYEVGTHTAEIWYNGKIIGKQTFTVSY